MTSAHEFSDVTCRMPRDVAIARGPLQTGAPTTPAPAAPTPLTPTTLATTPETDLKAILAANWQLVLTQTTAGIVATMPAPTVTTAGKIVTPEPTPGKMSAQKPSSKPFPSRGPQGPGPTQGGPQETRVLEALRANPLIGKSRILELSGVGEAEYPAVIKSLLAQNLIEQEGERRGAKYKAK